MATKEELLELVSNVSEINNISEELNDELVDEALGIIIRLTMNDDVTPGAAAKLVVKTSAMSQQFKMRAKNFMYFETSASQDKKARKGIYMSLHESLEALSNALKYIAKS